MLTFGTFERVDVDEQRTRSPSVFEMATEAPRVLFEAIRLSYAWPWLLHVAPRGDGHPVMVIPGFMGGDDSTLYLRRFLTRLGYVSLPWLQGQNTGLTDQLEGVMRRFYRAHRAYGEKISLVGQSMGGIYARQITREFPDAVRCVVTLGSPFAADGEGGANPLVERLFEMMSGKSVGEMRERMNEIDPRSPLGVPTTSVYSRSDGVAAWETCIEEESELSENVEVVASHTGMSMNPDILHVVADRLAQDPDQWSKFPRHRHCPWIYPKPATLADIGN